MSISGKHLVISIHVPKTAGTTIGYLLDYGYGRRVFWDYADDYRNATELDPLTRNHLEFLEGWFRVIHGHFFYQKYADVFPAARYLVTIRHPVARIKSQFFHVALDPDVVDWRREAILSGRMDIVEFTRSDPNISRALSNHTAGRRIEDFEFVFVTEHLGLCVDLFQREFTFTRKDPHVGEEIPMLNLGRKRELLAKTDNIVKFNGTVTPHQEREVYNLVPEDVDLYIRALEKIKNLRTKFGC